MTAATQSALVVAVREADPIIDSWRLELDPGRHIGAPAHITLLFPFAPPSVIDDGVKAAVGDVLASFPPFDFVLDELRWFDDRVVYLAPNPATEFRRMIIELTARFPEYPRYEGAYDDVIPHLTVGENADPSRMRAAAVAIQAQLPIAATVEAVSLLTGDRGPNSWNEVHRWPLTPR